MSKRATTRKSSVTAKSPAARRPKSKQARDRLLGSLPRRRVIAQAKRPESAVAAQMPVHIRTTQGLAPVEREYVRRRLGEKLRKHAMSVERISVRMEDVNGPRGGVDQSCRIKIVLVGLPSVVFESRDATLSDAVDAAILGAERAVRRATERRRMKPLRRA